MTLKDRWIDRYLRRVRCGEFLQRAAQWLAGFLLVFGAALLVVKLLVPQFWPNVLWLGLVVIPVFLTAWLLSRRATLSRAESVALLDGKLGAGGLLMTLTESPDALWEERLPQAEHLWRDSLPKLRPARFLKLVGLPVVFAVAAGLVPLRQPADEAILANTVGQQASQQLEELFDRLDEAAILEEEEKDQLREEIDKLAEETQHTPLTHEKWETVDALQDRLRLRLETAGVSVEKALEAVAALAEGGTGNGEELSAERIEELKKDVFETLEKMAKAGRFDKASPAMRDQLERLMKNGELRLPQDAAAREQLLDELKEFLDQESEKLSELREACRECAGGT